MLIDFFKLSHRKGVFAGFRNIIYTILNQVPRASIR